jgi:hypothetical protein
VDLEGRLLNCFVGGEAWSTLEEDGRVTRIRNRIELSLGGRRVTIVQDPWVVREKSLASYRGVAIETTTVVVRGVQAEERKDVRDMLDGLSYLLSFATGSQVALCRLSQGEDLRFGERWAVVARASHFRPAFDIRSGATIRAFLELVWERYSELEGTRMLRAAIDLLVVPETRSLPLELKLAAMFMLLENLKATHATEQGYPFEKGYFRKEPGGKEKWSFKSLLIDMFGKVGMGSPDLSAIVTLRNDIVHSAVSLAPYDRQQEIYDECQDLAREYLLRLLGYRGRFRLYSGRGMTTKEIPEQPEEGGAGGEGSSSPPRYNGAGPAGGDYAFGSR